MALREESIPQFANPQEELAYLREQVALREQKLTERNIQAPKDSIVHVELAKHRAAPPEILHETFELSESAADEIVLDLEPEKDDAKIGELLGIAHSQGIKNAFAVAERLGSPHIADDFHRALVQYVKEGYPAPDLREGMPSWEVLHMTLYEISLPEGVEEDSQRPKPLREIISSMEQFYAGMLAVADDAHPYRHFTIEVAVDESREEAVFYMAVPSVKKALFEKQLLSIFPKARIKEQTNDYNVFVDHGGVAISTASLAKEEMLPIKTYLEFDYDPLNVLINSFAKLKKEGEGAAVQFIIKPGDNDRIRRYRKIIEKLEKGMKLRQAIKDTPESVAGEVFKVFKDFAGTAIKKDEKKSDDNVINTTAIEQIRKKIESQIPTTTIRIVASASDRARAQEIVTEIESSFSQFENSLGNKLAWNRTADRWLLSEAKRFSFRENGDSTLPLSLRELTTLMHFPQAGMVKSAPHLAQVKSGDAPAPLGLPLDGTLLGINVYRNQETKAYLTPEDRLRHLYIIGQTGTGKTTLMKNMIVQDIQNGAGVCMIDPHGSDIEDILATIPKERYEDVIYFDPAYMPRVMGLNMLEFDPTHAEQKTFVVNELFSIFRKLYSGTPESMGPAFEQYFRNATMLVLEDPDSGSTLIDVSRVLADSRYRELKLLKAKNPVVVQFWREIATKAQGEASLANIVPYITNKFDVFTANEIMRPIIAQQNSAFDFRKIMDERKILLVNLSKGRLGDINANLIGLILIGKILMAALSRVDSLGKEMPHFYLHIDEFQNVTTDSISAILSEARKYKLGLTIAHQFIAQIEEGIRDAVFGNVGSMAVFRVGAEDAKYLEPQFEPVFTQNDIVNIDNRNCYLRMLADGKPVKPFNVKTMPPQEGVKGQSEYLKQLSYFKYGKPREEVEMEITRRFSRQSSS